MAKLSNAALNLIAASMLIALLYYGRTVLAPVAFALFIIMLVWPVQRALASALNPALTLLISFVRAWRSAGLWMADGMDGRRLDAVSPVMQPPINSSTSSSKPARGAWYCCLAFVVGQFQHHHDIANAANSLTATAQYIQLLADRFGLCALGSR